MSANSYEEIRAIALAEFAHAGYAGTSLQRVAELAGLSKSSVLYHFASKEALLESVVGPALDRVERILNDLTGEGLAGERRITFVSDFVDLLLEHRLEVSTFLNQGPSLVDVPVIERANVLVERIAIFFNETAPTVEGHLRFGIALGGSAYILGSQPGTNHKTELPVDETRAALITILTELLSPVSVRQTSPQE
ncbi:MAG: TetR/AcrR family transcriptional regulator [Microbacteriaceae bacterium]